jgi:site-specific DNA recombinase
VWDRVQSVLTAHNNAGDRQRSHEHYLKGSVFCGSCGSRLMVNHATNNDGIQYDYFVCLGRHQKRTDCTRSAMRIDDVERVVERAWHRLRLTYGERHEVQELITKEFADLSKTQGREQSLLENQRDALLGERSKLLAAHYADAIPLDLLKLEQGRISTSLSIIEDQLRGLAANDADVARHLDDLLNLLQHCGEAYDEASPQLRRMMNQAFAQSIFIDEDGTASFELEEPIETLVALAPITTALPPVLEAPPGTSTSATSKNRTPTEHTFRGSSAPARRTPQFLKSLNKQLWVDPRRFELLTSSMRTRRATNCAKGP